MDYQWGGIGIPPDIGWRAWVSQSHSSHCGSSFIYYTGTELGYYAMLKITHDVPISGWYKMRNKQPTLPIQINTDLSLEIPAVIFQLAVTWPRLVMWHLVAVFPVTKQQKTYDNPINLWQSYQSMTIFFSSHILNKKAKNSHFQHD